mmetsp:Transcript_50632/g.156724  ORF Transcript_50632/g.156724 Transcript_50632/m.156724 type:complete len:250 (+) Transcript_50632:935-1684(+)
MWLGARGCWTSSSRSSARASCRASSSSRTSAASPGSCRPASAKRCTRPWRQGSSSRPCCPSWTRPAPALPPSCPARGTWRWRSCCSPRSTTPRSCAASPWPARAPRRAGGCWPRSCGWCSRMRTRACRARRRRCSGRSWTSHSCFTESAKPAWAPSTSREHWTSWWRPWPAPASCEAHRASSACSSSASSWPSPSAATAAGPGPTCCSGGSCSRRRGSWPRRGASCSWRPCGFSAPSWAPRTRCATDMS